MFFEEFTPKHDVEPIGTFRKLEDFQVNCVVQSNLVIAESEAYKVFWHYRGAVNLFVLIFSRAAFT